MARPINQDARRHGPFGLLGLLTVTAVILAGVAALYYRAEFRRAERARLAEQDRITLSQIVKETEAIRARLGRAPRDQQELESLLGRPMPHVHDEGRPTPIDYLRTGEDSFVLHYELWATDDWIYDSTKPEAGWVQHWY
jgi:hypothetical protein